MNIGALISVRNKSERFPGKILKPLGAQSVFEHLVDRVKTARAVDRVIIATSDDPRDEVFVDIAARKQIDVFRGSRADKLARYLDALERFGLDAGIIIDGDDILCFPEIIDETAKVLREQRPDAVLWRGLPLGAASSGLTKRALARVMQLKNEEDTEVWGGYFTRGDFDTRFLEPDDPLLRHPEVRMTLDYEEDFAFLEAVFGTLYAENPRFDSRALMHALVNTHPQWNDIARPAQARYEANIAKAAPVRFKTESTTP